ncbi:MFS transporter [Streptomyces rubiginosohelvolus]|uniref:MFS transporter n=1 Tax=Streptomyces rubiginosohelvolus TaxID=67362 RepID=UPI00365C8A2F
MLTGLNSEVVETTDKRSMRYALLISLAAGIGYLPFALTLPILPGHVTDRLHGGPADVGAVVSGYAVTSLLFRPVSGVLTNRLGTRALSVAGAVLTALPTVCYPLAGSTSQLVGLRLLVGVGMGVMHAATGVWPVQLVAKDRQNWALGLGGTVNYLALGLGVPLGTLIAHWAGTAGTFVVAGLVTLLVIPIVLCVPEVRLSSKTDKADVERRRAVLGTVLPSVALILTAFGFAAVATFAVAKFNALGVAGGAAVVTAYSLTVVLLRTAGTWIRWEATRPRTLVALFLVEAVGIALVGLSGELVMGVVGGVLTGVGMWQIYPALGVFVVRSVSERGRALALSVFGACFTAGVAIGSGSLGLIAQAAGYQAMFLVCAACILLGLLVAMTASRVRGPAATRG